MSRFVIDNKPEPILFDCNKDKVQRTIQNAKNLIMTRMGEVPFDRMRGINPALFDLPISKANEALMPEVDRVLGWEPDADAVSASATLDDDGDMIITVVIEVMA